MTADILFTNRSVFLEAEGPPDSDLLGHPRIFGATRYWKWLVLYIAGLFVPYTRQMTDYGTLQLDDITDDDLFETGFNPYRPRLRPTFGEWSESELDWMAGDEIDGWLLALRSAS